MGVEVVTIPAKVAAKATWETGKAAGKVAIEAAKKSAEVAKAAAKRGTEVATKGAARTKDAMIATAKRAKEAGAPHQGLVDIAKGAPEAPAVTTRPANHAKVETHLPRHQLRRPDHRSDTLMKLHDRAMQGGGGQEDEEQRPVVINNIETHKHSLITVENNKAA